MGKYSCRWGIADMQKKIIDLNEKERLNLPSIPDDFNSDVLLKNLKHFKWIDLIPEICRIRHPMIHYDLKSIHDEYISEYDLVYSTGKNRKEARKKYNSMKEKFKEVANKLATTG